MPAKKFTEKVVANPFKNKNIGRRTGKDIKAGKNIRKTVKGFENFDDYWSESEADITREGTFVKPSIAADVSSTETGGSEPEDVPDTDPAVPVNPAVPAVFQQPILAPSQIGNIEPVKNAINPYTNKQIGRRTGKDIKAGKSIRMLNGGFENFDDYWSESDADSVASFSTTISSVSKSSTRKRSSGPTRQSNKSATKEKGSTLPKGRQDSSNKVRSMETREDDNVDDQGEAGEDECHQNIIGGDIDVVTSHEDEDVANQNVDLLVRGSQKDRDDCQGPEPLGNRSVDEKSDDSQTDRTRKDDGSHESVSEEHESRKTSVRFTKTQSTRSTNKHLSCRTETKPSSPAVEQTENPSTTQRRKSRQLPSSLAEQETSKEGSPEPNSTNEAVQSRVVLSQELPEDQETSVIQAVDDGVDEDGEQTGPESQDEEKKKSGTTRRPASTRTSVPVDVNGGISVETKLTEPESLDEEKNKKSASRKPDTTKKSAGSATGKAATPDVDGEKNMTAAVTSITTISSQKTDVVQDGPKSVEKRGQNHGSSHNGPTSLIDDAHLQAAGVQSLPGKEQLLSQTSTSQMNAVASPLMMSQKSLYMSIAGDVTGSITRLTNKSILTPDPKMFGTRKRLSYAESPKTESQPTAMIAKQKSRLPKVVNKGSNMKRLQSPIPEDHTEIPSEADRLPLKSAPQAGENKNRNKKGPVSQWTIQDSEKQLSELQIGSEGSLSEVGMFVSLAGHSQTSKTAHSSLSDSDDDFQIIDESKTYGTKKRQTQRKSKSSALTHETGSSSDSKEQNKNKSKRKQLPPKEEKEGTISENTDAQPKKTRGKSTLKKIAKRKPFPVNDSDQESASSDTGKEIEDKNQTKHGDDLSVRNDEDMDLSVANTRKRRTATRKGANRQTQSDSHQAPLSTDRETQKQKVTVKKVSKKGKGKKSLTVTDNTAIQTLEKRNTKNSNKKKDRQQLVSLDDPSSLSNNKGKQAPARGEVSQTPKSSGKSGRKSKPRKLSEQLSFHSASPFTASESETSNGRQRVKSQHKEDRLDTDTADLAIEAEVPQNQSGRQTERERVSKSGKRQKRSQMNTENEEAPRKKGQRRPLAASVQENSDEDVCTPGGQSLSHIDLGDSTLKSGISFRRFSNFPSSLKTKHSQKLIQNHQDLVDDVIPSPSPAKRPCLSKGSSPLVIITGPPSAASGHSQASTISKGTAGHKKQRRVTICNNVTHHHISPDVVGEEGSSVSVLPSMSATPVHYHLLSSPVSAPSCRTDLNKIVHPDDNSVGLRRSQRTRVKPLEWYKNERIIYDRRKSGPVIMAVQPSREHLYKEHENLKRRKRRQKLLVKKKHQSTKGRVSKRLSTHIPLPSDMDVTVSTDIPVVHPDTQEEVLMGCFNPGSKASTVGPTGDSVQPDDPFSLKLMTEQSLFTTGVLTLAPTSEKPLQRTISTAVLYFITYGKILVTINRASAILETGDHFFVPRGTVYRLRNLRKEEASLSFANLMVDSADATGDEQPN